MSILWTSVIVLMVSLFIYKMQHRLRRCGDCKVWGKVNVRCLYSGFGSGDDDVEKLQCKSCYQEQAHMRTNVAGMACLSEHATAPLWKE